MPAGGMEAPRAGYRRGMTSLISSWGALGVFVLMVPESACIPVPSEVTLLFSGFAVHSGWLSFPAAVGAATAGNVVGSLLAYALGASGLLMRLSPARTALRSADRLLERHGTRAVFSARLLPLARTFVSVPAGSRRVPLGRFTALTAAGCAIWAAVFVAAGILLGASWAQVDSVLGKAMLVAGALVLVIALGRAGER